MVQVDQGSTTQMRTPSPVLQASASGANENLHSSWGHPENYAPPSGSRDMAAVLAEITRLRSQMALQQSIATPPISPDFAGATAANGFNLGPDAFAALLAAAAANNGAGVPPVPGPMPGVGAVSAEALMGLGISNQLSIQALQHLHAQTLQSLRTAALTQPPVPTLGLGVGGLMGFPEHPQTQTQVMDAVEARSALRAHRRGGSRAGRVTVSAPYDEDGGERPFLERLTHSQSSTTVVPSHGAPSVVRSEAHTAHSTDYALPEDRSMHFIVKNKDSVWTVCANSKSYECIPTDILMADHRRDNLPKRATCFIAATMYNEPWELLHGTLEGIIWNMPEWRPKDTPESDMFPEPEVFIIVDGREKLAEDTREALLGMGAVDARLDRRPGEDVVHIYTMKLKYQSGMRNYEPMRVHFLIKELNAAKKLHSHKIFFGICDRYCPEYVMLLDVGTRPQRGALWSLFDAMERDPTIGGCAGEIEAEIKYTNAVVITQWFEYKIAHVLDKSLESVMGFVSVLPGAFSAYRYKAITDADPITGATPYSKYFSGLNNDQNPFHANINLAEDRILTFQLVARRNTAYSVKYILDSQAVTDVCQTALDLLKQRKRWLNGALFALWLVLWNSAQFLRSAHNPVRKAMIMVELAFLAMLTAVNILGPGLYFILFKFAVFDTLLHRPNEMWLHPVLGEIFAWVLMLSFLLFGLLQIILGSVRPPEPVEAVYKFLVIYYLIFQTVLIVRTVVILMMMEWLYSVLAASAFIIYLVGSFIHNPKDAVATLFALVVYVEMQLLFVIMLPMRAITNIDDVSWGTKGLDRATALANKEREREFQRFRTLIVCGWLGINILLPIGVIFADNYWKFATYFLQGVFWVGLGINGTRFYMLLCLRLTTFLRNRQAKPAWPRDAAKPAMLPSIKQLIEDTNSLVDPCSTHGSISSPEWGGSCSSFGSAEQFLRGAQSTHSFENASIVADVMGDLQAESSNSIVAPVIARTGSSVSGIGSGRNTPPGVTRIDLSAPSPRPGELSNAALRSTSAPSSNPGPNPPPSTPVDASMVIPGPRRTPTTAVSGESGSRWAPGPVTSPTTPIPPPPTSGRARPPRGENGIPGGLTGGPNAPASPLMQSATLISS